MRRAARSAGFWVGPFLLVAGAAAAAPADLRLVAAAEARDTAAVRALVADGLDVDTARPDGVTPLLLAAHWDDLHTARLLIEAGADVDRAEDHGMTPLARACENGSLPMVELLLAAGADPNLAQTSGLTPLMTAARTGNRQVVDALLAGGAHVDAVTMVTRGTALMWAVAEPHPDIVRALLAAGADPGASTVKGLTPLMIAAGNGDIPMATTLLAAGVDVNDLSADGTHVLPFAIVQGQPAFARFLLERGADPNGEMGGVRALHAAAGNVGMWLGDWNRRHGSGRLGRFGGGILDVRSRLGLVEALLARGADPNARITSSAVFMFYLAHPTKGAFEKYSCGTGDLRGATPVWVAAYSANGFTLDAFNLSTVRPHFAESSAAIIRALVAAGADPTLTTVDGTTSLMMAAGLGRATHTPGQTRGVRSPSGEAAVTVLLDAGVDVNARNEADFTALHGAAFRGLNEIVQILVERHADIDARDFRGRTPYRLAEGSKQSFQFQVWSDTAELLRGLGANPALGLPGTVQERLRDLIATDE